MLSHERIWRAIDRLAEAHDLTPSGLAKRAGLDSTTFNKSKRFASDGRARWPSTESLSKIMEATGASLREFTGMIDGASNGGNYTQSSSTLDTGLAEPGKPYHMPMRDVPVVGMAQAGGGGFFDDAGFPAGQGWDQVQLPGADTDNNTYALEITGDSMLPLYREGDIVIVSPGTSVRKGDRIIAKTTDGEVMAKILKRKTATSIELSSVNSEYADRSFAITDIEWMARIMWASQ